MSKVSRSWCYTLNNYTELDINQFKAFSCKKHRCAKEIGEKGTQHLQGAITFSRGYRISQLKKLNPRAHWEISKTKDAENYCTKGEIIIDSGFNNSITLNPDSEDDHWKEQIEIASNMRPEVLQYVTRCYKEFLQSKTCKTNTV